MNKIKIYIEKNPGIELLLQSVEVIYPANEVV
jgi:hypothetical protein